MKIIIAGNAKEIAALVLAVQERRENYNPKMLDPEEIAAFNKELFKYAG